MSVMASMDGRNPRMVSKGLDCRKDGLTFGPPPHSSRTSLYRNSEKQGSNVRLCSPLWIKQVYKAADFVFEIPAGQPFWDSDMHEPLLIAVLFPFIRSKPWQLRSTPKMYFMGGQLRKVFSAKEMDSRDILRKFWSQCHRLRFMPENVVRKVLFFNQLEYLSCRGSREIVRRRK